jgi:membrane-associated phospholipid phosphatase
MTKGALPALVVSACLIPLEAQQSSEYKHPAADPAHDLTGKEFLKDLGGNFTGLVARENILPFAGWTAAYAVATVPEQDLEKHFAPGGVWGSWSTPGKYLGNAAILGPASLGLFLTSRHSEDRRFRAFSYSLLHGMITSVSIGFSAKAAFHRLRPNGENHLSFPSGHAMDSFLYATVAADHYGWKAALPAYTIATYIAASRLPERKHHLTDVVGGAAMGYLIGKTVSRRMKNGRPPKVTYSVVPLRRGVVASIRIALSEPRR